MLRGRRVTVPNRVPILMYHEVTETPHSGFIKYSVTRRAFAAQMRWLALAGYQTIDLPTLLAYRQGQGSIPRRPIIITFDDGFRDCAVHAARAMAEHGFSATFFVVAGLIGGSSVWLRAERGLELPLMSWDDARALERAGHHCESHSVTHPRLAELSPVACRGELSGSRELIEDALGHAVRYLAYPFGSHNEQVRAVARECGYLGACSVTMGLSGAGDDALALERVPVLGTDSLFDFISRLGSAYSVGDRLSHLARSVTGRRARSTSAE